MVVHGLEFDVGTLRGITAAVEAEPDMSRGSLSRRICQWHGWVSPNGKLKEMTCRKSLLKLYRMGMVQLPDTGKIGLFVSKGNSQPVAIAEGMEEIFCSLEDLGSIELIPVEFGDREASKIWNALMDRFHYLGCGPLCGAQIRYIVHSSSYGAIGGLAFSAAAWRVAARDRWIGWNDETRRNNLAKVICNSRFLLVPRVPNLASYILGRVMRRIKDDWRSRYGIEPLLVETYVQLESFRGTCYQASNWQHIGFTQGRGRMDADHSQSIPVKDIYVFSLTRNVRELLCSQPAGTAGSTKTFSREAPNMLEQDWAEKEFGRADFGDLRLTKRLVAIAQDLYARPQANFPQACQTRARTKAAYRFMDNSQTTMEKILEPHYESTLSRIVHEPIVLAVQDSTSLDYSTHPATENLGPIAHSINGKIGLIVHDTMAFNPEGTPLGLLDVQCWARDPAQFGKKKRRHELPIEEKESYKWLRSFKSVAKAQKSCPNSTIISVGDREADIYELFELALSDHSGPKLLVRAYHNRTLAKEQGHLWDVVSRQSICSYMNIRVPRRSNQPARDTTLAIRFVRVSLKPPPRKAEKPEVNVYAVLAGETPETAVGKPIEWVLLTTCEINSGDAAVEIVRWYTYRWGIEVYHRTLKSGCKIEERQLGDANRIEACLAIDMVVAWRIQYLTKLGRETPDVPCSVFFEEHEWKALVTYWTQKPSPSNKPPTLREAVRMTAQLGGFLGRKSDGEPGTKTMWLGLQRLDDLATMFKLVYVPHPKVPPVSSDPGCG